MFIITAEKNEKKRQAIAVVTFVLKTEQKVLYFTNSINVNIEFNHLTSGVH